MSKQTKNCEWEQRLSQANAVNVAQKDYIAHTFYEKNHAAKKM